MGARQQREGDNKPQEVPQEPQMPKAEAVVLRRLVTSLVGIALRGFVRIGLAERVLGLNVSNHVPGDDPGK